MCIVVDKLGLPCVLGRGGHDGAGVQRSLALGRVGRDGAFTVLGRLALRICLSFAAALDEDVTLYRWLVNHSLADQIFRI